VFSHGWPLNADAWDDQLFFLANNGYRTIAHDRRGHGRSTQTWAGNDMDTYADDLATLVKTLSLTNVIHVGHSTGGGEVTRYIGRHGTTNVAKAVLVDATYKVYKGAPHGLMTTHQSQFNADLLEFARQKSKSTAPGRRGSAEPASRAASST
jgi:non-heme chloroperoxidase